MPEQLHSVTSEVRVFSFAPHAIREFPDVYNILFRYIPRGMVERFPMNEPVITQFSDNIPLLDRDTVPSLPSIFDCERVQLDPGVLRADLARIQSKELLFEGSHLHGRMRARGGTRTGHGSVAVVIRPGKWMRFATSEVLVGDILLCPPGAEFECAGGEDFEWFGFGPHWATFCEFLESNYNVQTAELTHYTALRNGDSLTAIRNWWNVVRHQKVASPISLSEIQALISAEVGKRLEAAAYAPPSIRQQRHYALIVEDYLLSRVHENVEIAELCKIANVSRRTLEYSFQRVFGMSPHAYNRLVRLNRSHTILSASKREWGLVKRIALECGFTHLGEFSRDYRNHFGELPSDTLQASK